MYYTVAEIGGKYFALHRIETNKTDTWAKVVILSNYFIGKPEKIALVIYFKFDGVDCVAFVAASIVLSFDQLR